jgi:hypothetical protein
LVLGQAAGVRSCVGEGGGTGQGRDEEGELHCVCDGLLILEFGLQEMESEYVQDFFKKLNEERVVWLAIRCPYQPSAQASCAASSPFVPLSCHRSSPITKTRADISPRPSLHECPSPFPISCICKEKNKDPSQGQELLGVTACVSILPPHSTTLGCPERIESRSAKECMHTSAKMQVRGAIPSETAHQQHVTANEAAWLAGREGGCLCSVRLDLQVPLKGATR